MSAITDRIAVANNARNKSCFRGCFKANIGHIKSCCRVFMVLLQQVPDVTNLTVAHCCVKGEIAGRNNLYCGSLVALFEHMSAVTHRSTGFWWLSLKCGLSRCPGAHDARRIPS